MIFLWIILAINLYFLVSSYFAIKQLKFSQQVLRDIDNLYSAGIISEIQARVFLNDMTNPFDMPSIIAVKRELDRIVMKYLQDEQQKNTNR